MRKQIFTAIIFMQDKTAAKYRNITQVENFLKFISVRYPDAVYVNFYFKDTKNYSHRVYTGTLKNDLEQKKWNEFLTK